VSRLTPEEYLERERKADYKSEYFQGEVFAMAGASRRHSLIVTNLVVSLHGRVKGRGCEVHLNDLRLRVPATGLYTYPDVMVVCGTPSLAEITGATRC
jgi:Uma2 family endonuclease